MTASAEALEMAKVAALAAAEKLAHEVTVIDREAEPASFTSYSNAGLFAPGHAYAWSSPAAPGILLRSLWRGDQALRFKFSADPKFWTWMWKFWCECTAERAALNTTRKVRLCNYSLSVFHDTVKATGVGMPKSLWSTAAVTRTSWPVCDGNVKAGAEPVGNRRK